MERDGTRSKVENATRIVLRPIASPLPLAFFAFGVGSVLQSASQFGLIPQDETRSLAFVFGAFVFPLQALAGILAFYGRETLGATVVSLISFSWLATAFVTYTAYPDQTSATLGIFNLALAPILLLLGAIGVLGKPLLSAVIVTAFFRYGLNGFYELTAIPALQTASGIVGCVLFLGSMYGGLALGLEDVRHKPVLPLGRRGEAKEAIDDGLASQLGSLEKEAGVRKQL